MFKTLILGLLILCTSAFPKVSCALEKPTVARSLTISTPNATTLPFKEHLYTIWKNQSHIHVNSTDDNHQPCDIKIDADKDLITHRFEYVATEHEIFIVGVRSIVKERDYKDLYLPIKNEYTYTILKVDPQACSYQPISIPETNEEKDRGAYFLPRLARHRGGTDVFFPSLRKCAPCRLNNLGLRTNKVNPQLPKETRSPGDPFLVRFVEPISSYLYIYNAQDVLSTQQEALIKLLDADGCTTVKERKIDRPVHTISRQKKSIGQLGICSKVQREILASRGFYEKIQCDKLDSNLDTVHSIHIMPTGPAAYSPISSISYEFDEDGKSYISFAADTQLQIYIHDADGKLLKAVDLGEIDSRIWHYSTYSREYYYPYEHWDVRGFLVGSQYCVVAEQVSRDYEEPLNDVKCIDVDK